MSVGVLGNILIRTTREAFMDDVHRDYEFQNSTMAAPLSAESLKRSRNFDTSEAEDANLRRRKRAIVATSERPEGEL